jgi:putative Mg2+ transporter-C (MgtC) family protein
MAGEMNLLMEEIFVGLPDMRELARFLIRLTAASLFGALIGWEREKRGKAAGLRTHMLVALGSALFVVASLRTGLEGDALSRVIQGVVTGIGFIGAGAILKVRGEHHIEGLTTAASIWLTCAIGVTVGQGGLGLGFVSVLFALVILSVLGKIEARIKPDPEPPEENRLGKTNERE